MQCDQTNKFFIVSGSIRNDRRPCVLKKVMSERKKAPESRIIDEERKRNLATKKREISPPNVRERRSRSTGGHVEADRLGSAVSRSKKRRETDDRSGSRSRSESRETEDHSGWRSRSERGEPEEADRREENQRIIRVGEVDRREENQRKQIGERRTRGSRSERVHEKGKRETSGREGTRLLVDAEENDV